MLFKNKDKSNNLIALDINKENMSIMQLDGVKVKSFNTIKTPMNVFTGTKISKTDLLQHAIKSLIEGVSFSGKKVSLSIPEENVLKHTIKIDKNLDDREIYNHISENASKIADNINIDEYNFDYHKIESSIKPENKDDKTVEINIFFIKKEEINIYADALSILDLELAFIDLDYLCLERLIRKDDTYSAFKNDIIGYFHVNKHNTKVLFFKDGRRIFEYTSEDYNFKAITETEGEKNGAKASETGGIDLELDVDIEEDEKNEDSKELSLAGYSFIDFISSNTILIDTEDKDFKIFCSVDESELDFDYSDLNSHMENVEVFQSEPFKDLKLPKKEKGIGFENISSKLSVFRGLTISKEVGDVDINLHDWRGELIKDKTKKFQTILGGVALLAGLAIVTQHLIISTKIKNQQARNSEIQKVIDIDIAKEKEINALEIEKDIITKKIETINELQVQRPNIVKLFTSVVLSTPQEVNLIQFNRNKDGIIELKGKSTEEKKIFDMIKYLESSEGFYDVKISQVTNTDANKKKTDDDVINPYYKPEYDFTLQMKEALAIKNTKEEK